MQYPDKIYECITGGETYLVTHEEAIVLSQSMRMINQNPGWRIWNKLNTTNKWCNISIFGCFYFS